jgi:hypothetical protein
MLQGRVLACGLGLACVSSCTPEAFQNVTTSLGGQAVGRRGQMFAVFVNNTPFSATFTAGGYDTQDEDSFPEFAQFCDDPATCTPLPGNSTSNTVGFTCFREMSVGGTRLIQLIFNSEQDDGLDGTALTSGVQFFLEDLTDPTLPPIPAGTADPQSALLGVDFRCEAVVFFTFEQDATAPGGFRIDVDVVLD